MARAWFGGGVADFVVSAAAPGDPLRFAAATLTMWDAETGGTQVTDLLLGGVAVTAIPVGVSGAVPSFQGPDGVYALWADGGSGRSRLDAVGSIVEAAGGVTDGLMTAVANDPTSDFVAVQMASMAGVTPVDVYVAASGGDDAHNGLTRNAPKATIEAALADLAGTPARFILMAGGGSHVLAAGITVDVNLHSIVGQHAAVVDASGLAAGVAVGLNADTATIPYTRATRRGINGFEMVGPGKGSSVIGIKQEGAGVSQAVAHLTMHDVVVHGFGIGVQHGNHNYLVNHVGWDVWDCGVAVDAPSGLTNAGEGLRYFGGRIFNSDLGIRNKNTEGYIDCFGTSLDYNLRHVDVDGARVGLHGCHVEATTDTHTVAPFSVTGDGGTLRMIGGSLLFTGAAAATAPTVVDNTATGGIALFDGVFMHNLDTTTDRFASGSGVTVVRGTGAYGASTLPHVLGPAGSRAVDGGFEGATVADECYIRADTAAVTSRTTGANIAATTSTDQAHSGAQSLKLSKTFGGGSASQFALCYPAEADRLGGVEFYYRKPGAETGTIFFNVYFVALIRGDDGLPATTREQLVDTFTLASSSADSGWIRAATIGRVPPWATHVMVLAVLDSFVGPGAVYVDDVLPTLM